MKRSIFRFSITSLVILFLFACFSDKPNTDWPGWRGKNRDGRVEGFMVPKFWPQELNKVWQKTVGFCEATPALVDGKLYLHVKQDSSEVILCLDAGTGNEIWRVIGNPSPEVVGGAAPHPGPRSSPCVSNGKVFTLGVGGILTCLDSETGKIIWKNENYTIEVPRFYTSQSPLVVGSKCFVHLGGHDKGIIVAFDVETGSEIWKLEGEPCTYSSPITMEIDEKEILVMQGETNLLGISMDEGNLLWKIPTPTEQRFYNSSTPIIDGQNIIIAGQGTGTRSYSIKKVVDDYEFTQLWHNPDLGVSFNTPILKNGYLFAQEARFGKIFCLDAISGKECWADTTKFNRFASTLDAGKVIITLPSNGQLIVFEPNEKEYVELAKYQLAETPTYAHPVIAGNQVFIKEKELLTCWEIN